MRLRISFIDVCHTLELLGLKALLPVLNLSYEPLRKMAYHRGLALVKPLLTKKHMQDPLAWARKHEFLTLDMWNCVDLTNEAFFSTGGLRTIYVTHRPEEIYLPSCLMPKFREFSSRMMHGQISGLRKEPLVVYEKEWGNIT